MSMQTLTGDVDAAARNSDAYGLALAAQARQKQQQRFALNLFI